MLRSVHRCSRCQPALMPVAMPTAPPSPSLKFITAVKSEAQWDEQVMNAPSSTLCICDIYSKWCGPCVALGKRITNLSSDYMECVGMAREPPHRAARRHASSRVAAT